ncbi:hypothetical protein Pla144_25440 [Bythopirellula polymerisocia]|uniref:Ice-binding protein C-terminal domain-containing protein n=2 Tax=Bythopirellula polymerisocia TaxID=2528003 RepID=A0A5C6CW56_9BACT|nr:hypothetical protein Pla144_25440 [Bythopirellula polymerisocia]
MEECNYFGEVTYSRLAQKTEYAVLPNFLVDCFLFLGRTPGGGVMRRLLCLAIVCSMAAPASAAPTVDGTRDAAYGSALAVQTLQTQFGDNMDPNGFSNEGELDAGYATISGGRLYVMLTGNVGANFNKATVFIDSKPGGENVLSNLPNYDGGVSQNFGGLTFDAGFEADYHVFGRWGGGAFEVDIVDRAGGTCTNNCAGDFGAATVGSGTGIQSGSAFGNGNGTTSYLSSPLEFGFNNTNVLGVTGGTAASDPVAAAAVATGFEFSVALSDIGSPVFGDLIKIHAVYGNGDNNFHSNQVLAGLPQDLMNGVATGTGNLGGDGNGGFTGNLSGINFANLAGDQFFSIRVVPEPTSMALVGLAMFGLVLGRGRRS